MELPDGRLPESFGAPAFPEPRPFEIGSPARPVTPPETPAPPPMPSAPAARAAPRGKAARRPASKGAVNKGAVKRPPAVPVLQPPPKPAARKAGPVVIALVAFAVMAAVICCAVARNARDEAAGVAPGEAATTAPARAVEAVAAPSEVSGPCPAIGFLGADELGPDAVDARRAVQLAVSRHNESGSPACQVRLVEADTGHGGTGEAGAALARFGDDVIGVVGPLRDADVSLLGRDFERRDLPFVTPWSGDPASATLGLTAFHRLYPTDLDVADAAARLLKTRLKASKLFVVRHNAVADQRIADRLRRSVDVSVVATVQVEAAAKDYRALVERIRASGAEAVFFRGAPDEVGYLTIALRAAGFGGPVVGGEALLDPAYAQLVAQSGTNTFALCGCADAADEPFLAAFRRTFGAAPGRHAATAYDAATLLLDAITARAGSRADLRAALARGPFKLTQGTFAFTTTGDLDRSSVVVHVYRPDTATATRPAMLPVTAIRLT
ncbi:ABC transporter substrate-binding protein [Dactylosporangium sp. NPDC000244]|uniref:branched-chain amino acid ABC transporter substrate-binding protein n=1 Tax=Dactylosporangium sp. NPDC000244 TaxID=3154365 RepID=UPI003329E343